MGSILFSQNEVENGYYKININSSYASVNKRYYNFSDSDVVSLEPADEYTYSGFSRLYFVNGKIVRLNPHEKLNPKYDYISLGCYYDTVSPYQIINNNKAYGIIFEQTDYLDGLTVPNTDVYFEELRYFCRYSGAGWYGEKYYSAPNAGDFESNELLDVTDQYREGVRDFTYSSVYRGKDVQYIQYDSDYLSIDGVGITDRSVETGINVAINKKGNRITITNVTTDEIVIIVNGVRILSLADSANYVFSFDQPIVSITTAISH